jgi:hypothetical protein
MGNRKTKNITSANISWDESSGDRKKWLYKRIGELANYDIIYIDQNLLYYYHDLKHDGALTYWNLTGADNGLYFIKRTK